MTWDRCYQCKCQMWMPDALNEAALWWGRYKMTYRQLLEAIQTANELRDEINRVRRDVRRWKGTPEEQDQADAIFRAADRALDQEIDQ